MLVIPRFSSRDSFYFTRDLLGSTLGREANYPDRGFPWFPQIHRVNSLDSTSIRPRPLPTKFFVNCNSSTILR